MMQAWSRMYLSAVKAASVMISLRLASREAAGDPDQAGIAVPAMPDSRAANTCALILGAMRFTFRKERAWHVCRVRSLNKNNCSDDPNIFFLDAFPSGLDAFVSAKVILHMSGGDDIFPR